MVQVTSAVCEVRKCASISYLNDTYHVHWVLPARVHLGHKEAVMDSTAAGGEQHLGTGCEGLLLPLHSASGDIQYTVRLSQNQLSNIEQRSTVRQLFYF